MSYEKKKEKKGIIKDKLVSYPDVMCTEKLNIFSKRELSIVVKGKKERV